MAVSKVLSIEITDLTTHICEIGYNKKNPVIYKSIIFENPQYSVEDGFVLDRGPYKNALKEELNTARIKTKDVVFSLSSSKIINREVTIPDMKKELIAGLIENERNEYFPMDTTGHVFAFEIIEKIKETKQQRIPEKARQLPQQRGRIFPILPEGGELLQRHGRVPRENA